ncbi:MAG: hypothetical protein D6824_01885 [Planctomycetota bacterium]|nr:MAG: hypothetical protein D6824_01885 [Planctomycetota bacterium]
MEHTDGPCQAPRKGAVAAKAAGRIGLGATLQIASADAAVQPIEALPPLQGLGFAGSAQGAAAEEGRRVGPAAYDSAAQRDIGAAHV